jgi:hypothetical protein
LIPNCSQNLTNGSALKEDALSVTIFLGQPNLVMRSSRNPMITLWEALLVGMASIHLVKKSVAVRIHLCCPLEAGWISPIKSSPHCWKGPCYPRYLGITRRSCLEAHMVLDMEYREQERPEHGPGGPIFFFSASFVLSAVPASITTGMGLHRRRLLLHEVIGPRYHGMCHI